MTITEHFSYNVMSVYMYLKINALGDYKKKYDPFARLLALKRGVGVCSVVGVVSGFYGICIYIYIKTNVMRNSCNTAVESGGCLVQVFSTLTIS